MIGTAALLVFAACSRSAGRSGAPPTVPARPVDRGLAIPPTSLAQPPVPVTTGGPPDAVFAGEADAAARCDSSQLVVGAGQARVGPPTGQNPLAVTITNASPSACELSGYPEVALVGEGGDVLPFEYHEGGDQVVTGKVPAPVELGAGHVAHVMINKYRCDRGLLEMPAVLELRLPDAGEATRVPLPEYPRLGYCGPGDPGSRVAVSPVEPTVNDTLAR